MTVYHIHEFVYEQDESDEFVMKINIFRQKSTMYLRIKEK